MRKRLAELFPTIANMDGGKLFMLPVVIGLMVFYVALVARPIFTYFGIFMHKEEAEECPFEGYCDDAP
jgi:hypothetical protein